MHWTNKKKMKFTLVFLLIGWLAYRFSFPFGISEAAQQAAINDIFKTAEITHIRIAYACCGNAAPVETQEVPFGVFRQEDQEKIQRLLQGIRWKSQYTWIPQRMPGIELKVNSSDGSARILIRQALHALAIKRPLTTGAHYRISGDFYELQAAVCEAIRNQQVSTKQIMTSESFEHTKKFYMEMKGKESVEATFCIRLPDPETPTSSTDTKWSE